MTPHPAGARPHPFLAASGWLALVATALPAGNLVRIAAVALFLFFAPGVAVVRHWRGRDPLGRFILAIALSAALAMLVAEGQALAHVWAPRLTLVLLAGITSVAALVPAAGTRSMARP
jgi:hypothetical protein